jgi:WXG100 family type VII secretion target
MGKEISKTDQVLLDSAKDLETTYDDVTGDLRTMRTQLENLQSQWVGRGGTAFQNTINNWQNRSNAILAAMGDFKEALKDTEAHYDVTESDVEAVFNKYSSLDNTGGVNPA